MTPRIPAPIQAELNNPAPSGDRHRQMKETVKNLLGNGLSPEATFSQYRSMYDQDVTDREIWSVINWAIEKNPGPSGYGNGMARPYPSQQKIPVRTKAATSEEATQNAKVWLGEFACSEQRLRECSKWFPGEPTAHGTAFLVALHSVKELICINTVYSLDGTQKARIRGSGQTMEAGVWIDSFCDSGHPVGDAGVWVRLNPLKAKEGSGHEGAHTDDDVASFRYLLIESDKLPIDLQLSVLAKVKLPISAIYLSGGSSVHAAVKLDAPDIGNYRRRAASIMAKLAFMGFDLSNVNPSRYSRLPGCQRKIGALGDGMQRLLYLNPEPKSGEAICR